MEQEVDEYLSQGISAIDINSLKLEYCHRFWLVFKDKRIEEKVAVGHHRHQRFLIEGFQ